MDLTTAAVIIMGGWVLAIVAAGAAMALRPGGVTVRFAPAGAGAAAAGRRDEILLGGEAETLGNVRGTVRAVQLRPEDRRLAQLEVAAAAGLDGQRVPAGAILSADGRVVRLADGWDDQDGDAPAGAARLGRGMAVRSADGKRLGGLRLLCFDPTSGTATALVVAGRGSPPLRLLPIERVREVGPNGIGTDLPAGDWARLAGFATDWEIRQAFLEALASDPALRELQRSVTIDVRDQVVTLRGTVADQAQAEQVARLARSIPGVMQLDRKIVTDQDMARAVTEALRTDPSTRTVGVEVSAHHGTVDIVGTAPDAGAARKIEGVAARVAGVQVVHNMVSVRRPA